MRKRVLLAASILVLSLLVMLQGLQVLDANPVGFSSLPVIYIKEDGAIEPQIAPIQKFENTYTLTSDIINYSITIERDNIILDGKGFTLQGRYNNLGTAITMQPLNSSADIGRFNVTIRNLSIKQFGQGIYAPHSLHMSITENTIECQNGINISHSSFNQINNNTLVGVGSDTGCGVWVGGSWNGITENNISRFNTGITLFEGDHNIVRDNELIDTTSSILENQAIDSDLRNNTVSQATIVPPTPGEFSIQNLAGGTAFSVFVVIIVFGLILAVVSVLLVFFKRRKSKTA